MFYDCYEYTEPGPKFSHMPVNYIDSEKHYTNSALD